MDELALVVHALAADVFVPVILRPRLLRFLKLSADAVAAHVGGYRAKPVIEHAGLELKADPEPNWLVPEPRQQGQAVIAAHEATLEVIDFAFGPERGVVQLDRLGQQLVIDDNDFGLGHECASPREGCEPGSCSVRGHQEMGRAARLQRRQIIAVRLRVNRGTSSLRPGHRRRRNEIHPTQTNAIAAHTGSGTAAKLVSTTLPGLYNTLNCPPANV